MQNRNQGTLTEVVDNGKLFALDLKSGYWQIKIVESDKYKTAFIVPFGHYEWNVMPFELKNVPLEFQNIINDNFNPYTRFIIFYIDDVQIYYKSIHQQFKHLNAFYKDAKMTSLVILVKKIKLF